MIRIPSIKTILTIPGADNEIACKVRAILEGKLDPCEASASTERYRLQCYGRPASHELVLMACDDLLGMHGVESIENGTYYNDEGTRMCPRYSYCNTGDTYAPTLIRDHKASKWLVASWGDLVEKSS